MRIDCDVAVIVCAGPSLDAMSAAEWNEIRKAGAIVAVNGAAAADACARHDIRFTHLAAMDLAIGLAARVPRLAEIWSTTDAWRVTSRDTPETPAESYVHEVDEADGVAGWSDEIDGGYKGGSTGMIIGNWLGNQGWRKLAYVGLDMHPLDGRHAAGAGNHASGFSDTVEHYHRVCAAWGKFVAEAAKRGIEVVNLTRGSGLAEMPCCHPERSEGPGGAGGTTRYLCAPRPPRSLADARDDMRPKAIAFVACIERGELEEKGILLCRSIRRFGGRFANAPIYTFQPRRGTTISPETAATLKDLGVTHSSETLNRRFHHYAIGNKIFASARAEEIAGEEFLVFVDTDTIIASQPDDFVLPAGIDAAVRPVDYHHTAQEPDDDDDPFWLTRFRRVGSSGPGDPMDAYWLRLYELLGVTNEPYVVTATSGQRIRAYFNSGLIVVRRSARLFAQWRDDFLKLVAANHLPRNGQWHYMDQLSLAGTLTRHGHLNILDGRYNYPLPGRAVLAEPYRSMPLEQLVHVHYNKSLDLPDTLAEMGIDGPIAEWLEDFLPLAVAR